MPLQWSACHCERDQETRRWDTHSTAPFPSTIEQLICSGPAGSGINCSAPTFIDFISAVTGVSIKGMGINDVGVVAQANLYNGATFLGAVNINGNAEVYNPVFVDFSSYGALTRIELTNITDGGGIGWDDLAYTKGPSNVVPEPASLVLVAAGLAGLAFARRRFAR